jgi:hypothetical protein
MEQYRYAYTELCKWRNGSYKSEHKIGVGEAATVMQNRAEQVPDMYRYIKIEKNEQCNDMALQRLF